MSCQDCLIWVGRSYHTVEEYVEEAAFRGCSRQVPFWPAWAKQNQTRVFLAHRGNYLRHDKGVIFGYFVLRGVDVILTQSDCDDYKKLTNVNEKVEFWRERLPRSLPFKTGGKTKGSKDPEDKFAEDVLDFLLDFLISCEPDKRPNDNAGYGISTILTSLEEERWCGHRIGPDRGETPARDGGPEGASARRGGRPTLYFVDALERKIVELFCDLLKEFIKHELTRRQKERGQKKMSEEERKQAEAQLVAELKARPKEYKVYGRRRLLNGIKEFNEAVRKARDSKKSWVTIPKEQKGHAQARGALAVFKEPYPTFHRKPQAEFLGLLRIEGDELLKSIAAHYSQKGAKADVELPLCTGGESGRVSKPTSQLVTEMAQALQVNKEVVRKLIGWISDEVVRELRERHSVKLQGTGTLHPRIKNGRTVGVRFAPSDKLKTGILLDASPPQPKKGRRSRHK